MKILVTGSAGHLGDALVRVLRDRGHDVIGIDLLSSATTDVCGSIVEHDLVNRATRGVDAVLHAATLHKPHVESHPAQAFVDVNVTGTLNLLEAAARERVKAFVFTSTTSAFGDALMPSPGQPAAWITEEVVPQPKNIYGVTKVAAEDLCQLFHRNRGLDVLVLRTSRFFPEDDDELATRDAYDEANAKANEFLYRRVEIEDVVDAHRLVIERAPQIGFGRYIISATSPFTRDDLAELRRDAPTVLRRRVPAYETVYAERGWRMFPRIDRVYVNDRARCELGWQPRHDFGTVIARLTRGGDLRSELASAIGAKGYHRNGDASGFHRTGRSAQ